MAKKEKRTTCKFDMSRTGFTDEHGRMQSYSMCTMCGKWHKGQYGIFIDARVPDKRYGGNATEFNIRKKLCRKCAKELSEEILKKCRTTFLITCTLEKKHRIMSKYIGFTNAWKYYKI